MKVIILGTGTSCGVPQVGCTCPVCTSTDERDKRLRCSAIVDINGKRILIDCGPDFRQQMLHIDFKPLDAVLITHEHYDHVGGLDDLRPFSVFGEVNVYAEKFCADHLVERIPYCFTPPERRYPGVPAINLLHMQPGQPIVLDDGVNILPIRVMHGKLPIVGFRIGRLGYITDMSWAEDADIEQLRGIDTLIVNGLRHKEHPSHQTVDDAVRLAQRLAVREAYIVHVSHDVGLHAEVDASLPEGIHLAYDFQEIEVPE